MDWLRAQIIQPFFWLGSCPACPTLSWSSHWCPVPFCSDSSLALRHSGPLHPAVSSSQLPVPMGHGKDCLPACSIRLKYSCRLSEDSQDKPSLVADLRTFEKFQLKQLTDKGRWKCNFTPSAAYLAAMSYLIKNSSFNTSSPIYLVPKVHMAKTTKYKCTWKSWKFATVTENCFWADLEGSLYLRECNLNNWTVSIWSSSIHRGICHPDSEDPREDCADSKSFTRLHFFLERFSSTPRYMRHCYLCLLLLPVLLQAAATLMY